MKKIIALALSLMMVLACVSALAETVSYDAFELKFDDLPEGYSIVPVTEDTENDYIGVISKDDASPSCILLINFSDEWYGVNTWADATEDDIAAVEDDFYAVTEVDEGDIIFSTYKTQSGVDMLVVFENSGVFGALYTIYNSHEIELDVNPGFDENGELKTLTIEDLDAVIKLVENLEIVPAA